MQSVGVERAYRITGSLEKLAHHVEEKTVPRLREFKALWRRRVYWGDAVLGGLFLVAGIAITHQLGFWKGLKLTQPDWWQGSSSNIAWTLVALAAVVLVFGYLHHRVRKMAAGRVLRQIDKHYTPGLEHDRMRRAFTFNTRPWRSLFRRTPVGWGPLSRKRLQRVIAEANNYVQILNDTFTDPSGDMTPRQQPAPAVTTPVAQPSRSADTADEEIREPPRPDA